MKPLQEYIDEIRASNGDDVVCKVSQIEMIHSINGALLDMGSYLRDISNHTGDLRNINNNTNNINNNVSTMCNTVNILKNDQDVLNELKTIKALLTPKVEAPPPVKIKKLSKLKALLRKKISISIKFHD